MRDACEAEQGHRDADAATGEPVYETAAPEWVEPEPDDGALHTYTVPATRKPHPSAWSDEEEDVVRRAQSAAEAGRLYSETYGIWKRSQSAVTSRWYRLRDAGELAAPEPDEDPVFVVPHPTYRPGDRVRLVDNPDMVGEVVYVAANGRYASVQFPGPGPARVCAIDSIEGVEA